MSKVRRIVATSLFERSIKSLKREHNTRVLKSLKEIVGKLAQFEITKQKSNHPLHNAKDHKDIHLADGKYVLLYRYDSDVLYVDLRLQDVIDHDELHSYDSQKYKASAKEFNVKRLNGSQNIMNSKRDYGGAYDIDPYSYFTKEDLMEFAYELVDKIGETTGVRTDISDIYLDDDDRIVVELDCNGATSQQVFNFDMRRIRKPSDLKKYITPKFIKSFIDDFYDIGEIDDDVYERINRDLDK